MTLKVKARLQAFSSAIRRTFVQHVTRFQLTARSRGPSATAGLLVLNPGKSESDSDMLDIAHYNFFIHQSILTISHRNIAERVNQMMIYFPTSPK